jgi:hypothetical protein
MRKGLGASRGGIRIKAQMKPTPLPFTVNVDLQGVGIAIDVTYTVLAQTALNAWRGPMMVPAVEGDPPLLALIGPGTLHQRLEAEMAPDASVGRINIPLRGHLEPLHRIRGLAWERPRLLLLPRGSSGLFFDRDLLNAPVPIRYCMPDAPSITQPVEPMPPMAAMTTTTSRCQGLMGSSNTRLHGGWGDDGIPGAV